MTDSWAALFERANEYDVSADGVRTRLEAVRDGAESTSTGHDDTTDAGGDDA